MPIANDVGTILMKDGKLTDEQYAVLKKKAKETNTSLSELIRTSGAVDIQDWYRAQSQVLGVPYADLFGKTISRDVLTIIPEKLARNYKIAAIEFDPAARALTVAMADLLDLNAREALRYIGREQKLKIQYVLASPEGLDFIVKQYANITEEVGQALKSAEERFKPKDQDKDIEVNESLQEVIKHAPVAKMITVIMRHAVEGKASDIHIEPLDDKTRVRYRIDGQLTTSITVPLYVHDALIARVKVMASLKIDETRIPQDGRIRLSLTDRDVEFRVSTLPLQGHEKVVMRVLDTGGKPPNMADLGYRSRNLDLLLRNIKKPNGMILVTGPTGSGKSLTLFSALSLVNREEINISTLEDPVEYRLPGINQSQIHPNVGFSFASGLRALLRQDPNVILVGEIRDFETAELGIHAAMTGHVVFSTLHTNSAIESIPRLIDMKVEPYLIATTLNVLIAQRLVRRICSDCKEEIAVDEELKAEIIKELKKIPEEVLKQYGAISLDKPSFYKGKGCAKCGHIGLKGRTSINEVIENTRSLKKAMTSGMKQEDIDAVLREQNFVNMKQDGLIKAIMGITTYEQVYAVTKEEG
ncbi:MAG: Flp pilus assembly complex ATPase component TadA [Candidatus Jacksonbacteria bacterium]|nr:Flp pilus assembly complex ATPase component TadA [Candidatus Jacksonbacteria bacterium]